MIVRAGTSGFSYKEWKGTFYPEELKDAAMLGHYASVLPTVEINNTFYRMPKRSVLEGWAAQVPESFRFVLKISRRVTHIGRLKPETAEAAAYFFDNARVLGSRLGPVLVQLPPNMKKDVGRLEAFLAAVPADLRVALEFRHPSWLDDDATAALAARGAARCAADVDEEGGGESPFAALAATARFGYLRLRRDAYGPADLDAWLGRVRAMPWDEAWVFFKHEAGDKGPVWARDLTRLASA